MKTECRTAWVNSPEADACAEYYVAGHTVKETAEKYGVSTAQVNNLAKKRRLTNGRSFHEKGRRTWVCDVYVQQAIERISDRLDSLGLEYAGGYSDKSSKVKIRCKRCGAEFERSAEYVKKGAVRCRACEHEKIILIRKRQAEQRRAERLRRKEEAKQHKDNRSAYQLEREKKLDETHVCKVCSREYTIREYMKSIGTAYARNSGYCSAECRDQVIKQSAKLSHKGRRDSHRERARRFNCAYDPSITLEKLIKRDGLRCAICGEQCDRNDRTWSKYSGPKYPSIDHIIPMAKGGGHTWENVQVAHIICNSYKGDVV